MSDFTFLPEGELGTFIGGLDRDRILVNAGREEASLWKPFSGVDVDEVSDGLRCQRPANPPKGVLLPARELVARYGDSASHDPLDEAARTTFALVGLRACECRAISYLDEVMYDEPCPESFYQVRRENTLLVSIDCVTPALSCFCTLLGDKPYADSVFDINLCPMQGGYLVEVGSEAGRQVVQELEERLSDISDRHLRQRDEVREGAVEDLLLQNDDYEVPDDIPTALASVLEGDFWNDELGRCVQCGGCTAVCPTCYCFLLADRESGPALYERIRAWDSCQLTGYSVMAGPSGNKPDPRRKHMTKFQHRFCHKFWYDPVNWDTFGCVGCGRCGQTCPGAIDLRRVLTEMSAEPVHNE